MPQAKLSFITMLFLFVLPSVDAARKNRKVLRSRNASDFAKAVRDIPAKKSQDGNEVVVQLVRLPARTIDGLGAHGDATFYVGNITVGDPPQEFQVLFDTGSGHVLLPHKACKKKVCLDHHQYSPWASSTSVDVNEDGSAVQNGSRIAKGSVNRSFASIEFTQADLGEGVAKGVLVRDHVCLSSGPAQHRGHQACADLAMLTATDEDAMPFAAMPADGIIGLGLEGLAVSALSSFYAGLMDGSHNMVPEFGISLDENGGKMIFGGRAAVATLAAPLEWFPVKRPEDGMWQVEILSVRVGDDIVDSCSKSCHAIVDTSSSSLGVQGANEVANLRKALASRTADGVCQGPDVVFQLPRNMVLTLSAADYTNNDCEAQVGALNLERPKFVGVYSLGTNVLRRYYTAFDWATAQLGFAPNAGSRPLHARTRNGHLAAELITV